VLVRRKAPLEAFAPGDRVALRGGQARGTVGRWLRRPFTGVVPVQVDDGEYTMVLATTLKRILK
jgi:hypothetical protein